MYRQSSSHRHTIARHSKNFLLSIATGLSIAAPVLATPQPLHYVAPPPPPGSDRGSPTRQIDMGTRSPCGTAPPENRFLTALIPQSQPALTVSERPTFWVYVPYAAGDIELIHFSIQQDGSAILLGFTPPDRPGILAITLPDRAAPLEIGQTYQWSLSVSCNGAASDAPFVEGSVQRVAIEPALTTALEAASPREQAAIYAENGIWYDALTTLGNLYRTDSNNTELAADWAALLSALEIDLHDRGIDFDTSDIVTSPIVE